MILVTWCKEKGLTLQVYKGLLLRVFLKAVALACMSAESLTGLKEN